MLCSPFPVPKLKNVDPCHTVWTNDFMSDSIDDSSLINKDLFIKLNSRKLYARHFRSQQRMANRAEGGDIRLQWSLSFAQRCMF